MSKPVQNQLPGEAELTLLGDCHPLVQQLGATEGLHELARVSRSLRVHSVSDVDSLRSFLRAYQSRILVPMELPIIHQAYLHSAGGRTRELIALDQQVAEAPGLRDLANASQRVGQAQLRRLRPLRDVRVLQRYLAAVEAGEATGWHTLVFGLTLSIYSVPLRQGLLGYSQQVIRGFIHTAATRFQVSAVEIGEIVQELNSALPTALGTLLFLEGVQRSRGS
jgi:urease accessory protein UreF